MFACGSGWILGRGGEIDLGRSTGGGRWPMALLLLLQALVGAGVCAVAMAASIELTRPAIIAFFSSDSVATEE